LWFLAGTRVQFRVESIQECGKVRKYAMKAESYPRMRFIPTDRSLCFCYFWLVDYIRNNVSDLNKLVKRHMQTEDLASEFERFTLVEQLIRYGVCTCHCHFSTNVYHGAEPCCGNAKLTLET
jgi:hypothetical protein